MRLLLLEWKPYLWLACGLWPVGIGVIETFFPAGENGETLFLQSEKLQRQIEFGGHSPLPTISIAIFNFNAPFDQPRLELNQQLMNCTLK